MDPHDLEGDLEFRELVSEISARQKGIISGDCREASLHGYAAKIGNNIKFTMHMRNSFNRHTTELGVQLAIKAVRMISRVTQYSAKQF